MNAQALRVAGLAGIVVIAAIRALVVIEPGVWFTDVDPAVDPMPLLALGAAGSHLLDVLLMAASGLALVGEWRAGRGLHGWIVLLAVLPAPVVLLHGSGYEAGSAFRGDTWLAALCAFAAMAHLVRERRMRVIALSVLVGLMAMLAVRGAVQVLIEHPATVAQYNQTRDAFLADRGWLPDSSAARTFERRLMQPEATGWFGLSNPYSTMMGVGALALAALAVMSRRSQQAGGTVVLAVASAACAALLIVNGGKGAIAATALGSAVLVVRHRTGRPIQGLWLLAACALALAAVAARGLVGEGLSERSLLFRSYYLEAGWTLLRDRDFLWMGTGPDRLQEYFSGAKPLRCPEDVKSLHSVFADWVVTLGLSGVAWVAAIVLAFRGPIGGSDEFASVENPEESPEAQGSARAALWIALSAGAIAIAIEAAVESPTVDAFWLVTRGVGLALLVLLSVVVAREAGARSSAALASLAFALAAIVLVHAQIETVAWMPGSCVLALVVVAIGSTLAIDHGERESKAVLPLLLAAPLAALGLVGLAADAASAWSRDAQVAEAARTLQPIALERSTDGARGASFRAREVEARVAAAEALSRIWSLDAREDAVRQWLAVAALSGERADDALARAWTLANDRIERGPRSGLLRADVALARLRLGSPDWIATEEAVGAVANAAQSPPTNPRRWIDFGAALEIYWQRFPGPDAIKATRGRGSVLDPRIAYRRALEVNDQLALDPLAQLSDRERAFAEAALKRLDAGEMRPVESDPKG